MFLSWISQNWILLEVLKIVIKVICLLIAIAYYTIAERKIMAAIQRRRGPNVTGFWGLLQPIADGLKLIVKEMLVPTRAEARIFVLAPIFILSLSLSAWSIIPFNTYNITETINISYIEDCLMRVESNYLFGTTPGTLGIW